MARRKVAKRLVRRHRCARYDTPNLGMRVDVNTKSMGLIELLQPCLREGVGMTKAKESAPSSESRSTSSPRCRPRLSALVSKDGRGPGLSKLFIWLFEGACEGRKAPRTAPDKSRTTTRRQRRP